MKRNYLFFAILSMLTCSCSNEDLIQLPSVNNDGLISEASNNRTLEEAAQIARNAIGMLPDNSESRSGGRTFSIKDVKYGLRENGSRAGADTLMYVFNFDDEQGFVAVAANKNVPGLLAVTELGSYDPNEIPNNPGLAIYMECLKEELVAANHALPSDSLSNRIPIGPGLAEYKFVTDTINFEEVAPNYGLRWGQYYPEGMFAPNGVAGCSNTALAMIFSYLRFPTSIDLTFQEPTETLNINWNSLIFHHQSFNQEPPAPQPGGPISMIDMCDENTHRTLGLLCRELGHRNHSEYSMDFMDTGTNIMWCYHTVRDLGMNITLPQQGIDVANNLRQGAYIYAQGSAYIQTGYFAHTFIIDGFKYLDVHTTEWTTADTGIWHCINDLGITSYRFHHINWGWNGDGNGYFVQGNYNQSTPTYPDTQHSADNYSWNYDMWFSAISLNE